MKYRSIYEALLVNSSVFVLEVIHNTASYGVHTEVYFELLDYVLATFLCMAEKQQVQYYCTPTTVLTPVVTTSK